MNEPAHRTFLVVDVENSGNLGNTELEFTRSTLYRVLDEAITHPEAVVGREDRGDGFLLVLDLSVLDVLDHIVERLLDGVRTHNNAVDPLDWLRVRIAAHEGYVHDDGHGWMSDALTATFRLNDSGVVKATLRNAARAHGVVVVSDAVYQGVVRHNYRTAVTSAGYRSAVIDTKEGDVRVWVRVPGYPEPPLPANVAAPAKARKNETTLRTGFDSVTANNMIIGDVQAGTVVGRDNIGGGSV
ncbi:hypothetical protein ACFU44_11785 [Nocardia rhizosphaerihabitans]|uniref:hypothetical protein n=1 Tax=Nocardia rhizosphaerihabitans TaxID=1691570 RepID=UPI0036717558